MIIRDKSNGVNIITIDQRIITENVPIGNGSEGEIYAYRDPQTMQEYALKVLNNLKPLIFEKIKELSYYEDPNYCFPLGLFTYTNSYPNFYNQYEGFFMRLLKTNKNFDSIKSKDMITRLRICVKGDKAIMRGHNVGLSIGDIKASNILIEDEEPIIVDTGNIACHGFTYSLYPTRASWLQETYSRSYSQRDNDIFLYGYLVLLQILEKKDTFKWPIYPEAIEAIDSFNISRELKSEFKRIFSDSKDKPYLSPILEEIIKILEDDPERPLLIRKK